MNHNMDSTHRRGRQNWAAIGFLLIVSLSIIAYAVEPSVVGWLIGRFPGFGRAIGTMNPLEVQIAFTAVVFVILALIVALVVTLAAPKKPINATDKDLVKERAEAQLYKRHMKKQQRQLNREMREYVQKHQK